MVRRHYQDVVPGNERTLDRSEGRKWKMRASVIGFKGLLGAHSGENLGRYAVGLLDRVGIMNDKASKVTNLCHNPEILTYVS